jgi:hypothetical protein
MELEGTLQVERPPTRRWIPIVGAVIPVIGFVAVAAWFIRAFVAPPMVTIPAPGSLMSDAPAASVMARGDMSDARNANNSLNANNALAERAMANRAATQIDAPMQQAVPAATQLAALASSPASVTPSSPFPPAANSAARAPSPFPNTPGPAPMAAVTPQPADTPAVAEVEPGEPIKGPIPLPHPRPSLRFAQAVAAGPVPLPRPRPAEASAKPETSAAPEVLDRHNIQ